jgi:hypothetical protein
MNSYNDKCESCEKEFEKPIVVTNFSFTPVKETYYACPYCLTKISKILQEQKSTTVSSKDNAYIENKKNGKKFKQHEISTITGRTLDKCRIPKKETIQKLENLEKERMKLLVEVQKLRDDAIQKITHLEEDVAILRQEKEILIKMKD